MQETRRRIGPSDGIGGIRPRLQRQKGEIGFVGQGLRDIRQPRRPRDGPAAAPVNLGAGTWGREPGLPGRGGSLSSGGGISPPLSGQPNLRPGLPALDERAPLPRQACAFPAHPADVKKGEGFQAETGGFAVPEERRYEARGAADCSRRGSSRIYRRLPFWRIPSQGGRLSCGDGTYPSAVCAVRTAAPRRNRSAPTPGPPGGCSPAARGGTRRCPGRKPCR